MLNPYSYNVYNSASLMGVKDYTIKLQDPNGYTTDYYGVNDDKFLDKWKYENFNYTINKYGFRCPVVDRADIGAFGCSFTFGQSMPENRLWHKLLADKLGATSLNFGVPGRGIETIVDIFCIVSKWIRFKKAIFLLPPSTRFQICLSDENKIEFVDCSPYTNTELSNNILTTIPESHRLHVIKKSLYLAEYIAHSRHIEIYFGSWHSEIQTLLEQMKFSQAKVLPAWTDSLIDRARDMEHPGPLAHENWVNKLVPYFTEK